MRFINIIILNVSKITGYKKIENIKTRIIIDKSKISLIFILIFLYLYSFIIIIKKTENIYYKRRISKIINYNETNLITFQDKINWLIIHDTNKLKGKCADKILLHEYSKSKLGKDICNKIMKIYHNADEINLKELPKQFVLKMNHGCRFNIIVTNKSNLNISLVKTKIKKWMKTDYGEKLLEFHYSFIKKKIFVEEFIGNNLNNYKFLCYNGKPKYVYVSKMYHNIKYRNFYDMNWNFLNFSCLSEPHPYYKYKKPQFFELMKEYSKKLSSDFKFVRVDFYELENEVRLGELTFIPMNSIFTCDNKQDEITLGKDIITN